MKINLVKIGYEDVNWTVWAMVEFSGGVLLTSWLRESKDINRCELLFISVSKRQCFRQLHLWVH
jgi:hypothetical protein